MKAIIKKLKAVFPLLIILLIGLAIRVFGFNWDQGAFLHPDERFLIMVSQSLETPNPKLDYFDPVTSSFNPVNTGNKFYVYGSLPVVIHKLLGNWLLAETSFLETTLLGRIMSALADGLVIVLIYKMVELLEKPLKLKNETKFWASLLYALMVLPIQISHFFTADSFLNLFSLLGIYLSLKFFFDPQKNRLMIWSGLAFSLALASKLSAIYPLTLTLVLIVWAIWKNKKHFLPTIISLFKNYLIFFLTIYLGLRLFNPGYFADVNIFIPTLNLNFVDSLKTLGAWSNSETWFPPSIQWLKKPWWFTGKNLFLYGLGLPISIFVMTGLFELTKKTIFDKELKKTGLWLILAWVIGFAVWQSIQFVKTMRYLLIIYPWLAIMGAIGIERIKKQITRNKLSFNVFLIALIFIWPLAFINIYIQEHSRVQASIWLEENLPTNTVLLSEYWDDALPVARNFNKNKVFKNEEVRVFDQESTEKWNLMEQQLNRGEYYILSSNRAWASIMENPDRYPKMSEFYRKLLNNELSYKFEKQFEVYPSLRWLGIPLDFNDSQAEEAFTVYDHPTVMIFKKRN